MESNLFYIPKKMIATFPWVCRTMEKSKLIESIILKVIKIANNSEDYKESYVFDFMYQNK